VALDFGIKILTGDKQQRIFLNLWYYYAIVPMKQITALYVPGWHWAGNGFAVNGVDGFRIFLRENNL